MEQKWWKEAVVYTGVRNGTKMVERSSSISDLSQKF